MEAADPGPGMTDFAPWCAVVDTFLSSNRSKQRATELEGALVEKHIDTEVFDGLSGPLVRRVALASASTGAATLYGSQTSFQPSSSGYLRPGTQK
jgi:hypothetical protein